LNKKKKKNKNKKNKNKTKTKMKNKNKNKKRNRNRNQVRYLKMCRFNNSEGHFKVGHWGQWSSWHTYLQDPGSLDQAEDVEEKLALELAPKRDLFPRRGRSSDSLIQPRGFFKRHFLK
jgi:hypothetical protein